MCLGMITTAYAVEPTVKLAVTADKTSAKVGEVVTFTVTCTSTKKLYGLEAKLDIPSGFTYIANSGALADGVVDEIGGTSDSKFLEANKHIWLENTTTPMTIPGTVTLATFQCTASASGTSTVSLTGVSGVDDEFNSFTYSVAGVDVIVKAELTGDLPVTITKPAKGDTPETTISGTNFTGSITWSPAVAAGGKFAANTVYTAKVDLTAKSGYQFASSVNPTVADATSITEKTVSPDGNTLTFMATFPATADKDPASLADAPTGATGLTYNGTEQALLATNGTATNGTMQYSLNGTNWSTAVPKGKDAKTYTVYYMVKGDADHSDFTPADNTVTVTIDPKDIGDSDVTVDPIAAETYDGTAKTPAPVVKDGDDPLERDVDYTVSYSNHTNAGTATVTIKGKGNYGDQRTENFTINKAAQTITVPTGDQTVSFGNTLDLKTLCSSNAPGATLTFAVKSGSTLPAGTTLSGSTVTAGNTVGQFTVTVNASALPNYNAAAEKEITVKIVDLPAASVTTGPAAKTGLMYNGTEQALITAGVADGGEMQYKLAGGSYGSELPKAENAGTYTVYYKAKGDSAHSDSAEQSFTVTIGKKAATVAPKSFTITKGDTIPTFELIYTGLVSGDTLTPSAAPTFTCYESDGTTPVSTSTQAGTYTITWTNESTTTFTGADNYNLTKTTTATLTISNPPSGGGSSGGSSSVTTYAITASAGEGGKISPSGKVSAARNSNKTFTMTADEGYEIADVVVDGKSVGAVERYAFEQIRANHTIHVTFAQTIDEGETPLGPNPFTDVPEDSYYEDAVLWAVNKGITSGTSATTFAPDGICTRAQAVTFLWRAAGSPAPETSAMPFADVPGGSWYYDAVLWAVEQGITSGTSATTFAPDLNCTRAQIVTFLWRTAGSPAVSGSAAFDDVAADAYYEQAVKWAEANGITSGIGDGLFGSDNDCTRAQIVTFIYRYMEK